MFDLKRGESCRGRGNCGEKFFVRRADNIRPYGVVDEGAYRRADGDIGPYGCNRVVPASLLRCGRMISVHTGATWIVRIGPLVCGRTMCAPTGMLRFQTFCDRRSPLMALPL